MSEGKQERFFPAPGSPELPAGLTRRKADSHSRKELGPARVPWFVEWRSSLLSFWTTTGTWQGSFAQPSCKHRCWTQSQACSSSSQKVSHPRRLEQSQACVKAPAAQRVGARKNHRAQRVTAALRNMQRILPARAGQFKTSSSLLRGLFCSSGPVRPQPPNLAWNHGCVSAP